MGVHLIKSKIDNVKYKLEVLTAELNSLDHAVNNVESPDDAAILAGMFMQKVREFNELQERFKNLLEEYNELSSKEDNVVSFTAKKLLKVMS